MNRAMKRLGLMFAALSLLTACDPDDESLDDSGASGSDTAETENGTGSASGSSASDTASGSSASDTASGSSATDSDTDGGSDSEGGSDADTDTDTDGGSDSVNCTDIGDQCVGGFGLDFNGSPVPAGTYTVWLRNAADDAEIRECAFEVPQKNPSNVPGCNVSILNDETGTLFMEMYELSVDQALRVVITRDDEIVHDETWQPDYEVSMTCDLECVRADLLVDLTAPSAAVCDGLEATFDEAFTAVRSCEDASDCGTVIPGFSCGCTRDWVGRLDADVSVLTEAADAGVDAECDWAMWGSTCDCPETDGFACIDNICTWNYVEG